MTRLRGPLQGGGPVTGEGRLRPERLFLAFALAMCQSIRLEEDNRGTTPVGDRGQFRVMRATQRMRSQELAEAIGISEQNVSLLKSGRCTASTSRRCRESARHSTASRGSS